jgi:hypothetical protein
MEKQLRLTGIVRLLATEVGNFNRLESLIKDANAKASMPGSIAARTLRKLVENPKGVSLTWSNFVALENFLVTRGKSLQNLPIFETRGVLDSLIENPRISFLVAAKPRIEERRIDLSHWDVLCVTELVSHIYRLNAHPEHDIVHVPLRKPPNPHLMAEEEWHKRLEEPGRAIVCIGSPRVNLATELVLARMFGIDAFVPPQGQLGNFRRMPFCFVWTPSMTKDAASAFSISWESINVQDPPLAKAIKDEQAVAFLVNDKIHPVVLPNPPWKMFGAIVAQRRKNGQIWLVVCGTSGPATYAAAQLVKQIEAALPISANQHSPVLWVPIVADVATSPAFQGDNRVVEKCEFLCPPALFNFETSDTASPSMSNSNTLKTFDPRVALSGQKRRKP